MEAYEESAVKEVKDASIKVDESSTDHQTQSCDMTDYEKTEEGTSSSFSDHLKMKFKLNPKKKKKIICALSTNYITQIPTLTERRLLASSGLGDREVEFPQNGSELEVKNAIHRVFPLLQGYNFEVMKTDKNSFFPNRLRSVCQNKWLCTVNQIFATNGDIYVRPLKEIPIKNQPLYWNINLDDQRSQQSGCDTSIESGYCKTCCNLFPLETIEYHVRNCRVLRSDEKSRKTAANLLLTFHDKLYVDTFRYQLFSLQQTGTLCDLQIWGMNRQSIMAHRVVFLACTSEFFHDSIKKSDSKDSLTTMILPYSIHVLTTLVRYVYTGEIIVGPEYVSEFLGLCNTIKLERVKDIMAKFLTKIDCNNTIPASSPIPIYSGSQSTAGKIMNSTTNVMTPEKVMTPTNDMTTGNVTPYTPLGNSAIVTDKDFKKSHQKQVIKPMKSLLTSPRIAVSKDFKNPVSAMPQNTKLIDDPKTIAIAKELKTPVSTQTQIIKPPRPIDKPKTNATGKDERNPHSTCIQKTKPMQSLLKPLTGAVCKNLENGVTASSVEHVESKLDSGKTSDSTAPKKLSEKLREIIERNEMLLNNIGLKRSHIDRNDNHHHKNVKKKKSVDTVVLEPCAKKPKHVNTKSQAKNSTRNSLDCNISLDVNVRGFSEDDIIIKREADATVVDVFALGDTCKSIDYNDNPETLNNDSLLTRNSYDSPMFFNNCESMLLRLHNESQKFGEQTESVEDEPSVDYGFKSEFDPSIVIKSEPPCDFEAWQSKNHEHCLEGNLKGGENSGNINIKEEPS